MSTHIVLKTTIILLFIVLCFVSPTLAVEPIEFKLAWDANQEEDLDGYEIYFREGYPGSDFKLIGDIYVDELADPDNPMVTITDLYNGVLADPAAPVFTLNVLEDNSKFYFALKAFDQQGNVSDYSRELCVDVSGSSVYACKANDSVGGGGGGGGGG
jgi:hypothetical protein